VADPGARHIAWTLEAALEEPVRDALAAGSEARRVLVLGCGEGRLAHRLLEWGARRVVGVEPRARERRRAELLLAHYGFASQVLVLRRDPPAMDDDAESDDEVGRPVDAAVLVAAPGLEPRWNDLVAAAVRAAPGLLAVDADGRATRVAAERAREAGYELAPCPLPSEAEPRYVGRQRYVLLGHRQGS
jgi:SAM-dependent methyltransferase